MIRFVANEKDVDLYMSLRKRTNRYALTKEQASQALEKSLYTVIAYDGNKKVGFGRLVGDGCVVANIQDILVDPEWHGQGIGKKIVEHLVEYTKSIMLPNTRMYLGLMSVGGTEGFYEKCGFIKRPDGGIFGNGFTKVLDNNYNDVK